MSTHSLSIDAFERLQAELEDLTTRGRIEIANAIEAARALGDLKENGDYHAAKDSQGKMEARIRQIQAILSDCEIVGGTSESIEVVPGVVVHLRYEGDEDTYAFLVGSIEEKRPGVDVVSPTSPLGSALIGRKVGEVVQYEAPGGALSVTIVRFSN